MESEINYFKDYIIGVNEMFEWSKNLSDKIAKSGCLDVKEMQSVELALRLLEIHDHVMNEAIGADDGYGEMFDLKYQVHKNARKRNKERED